jgi:hypothetical protein
MKSIVFGNSVYYDTEWAWPYKGESQPITDKFIKGWTEPDLSWLWKLQGEILGSMVEEN